MKCTKGRVSAHVALDATSRRALETISAVLRAQGGRGSISDAVRFAAIRTARDFTQTAA